MFETKIISQLDTIAKNENIHYDRLKILAAISGGVDSMVLADQLLSIKEKKKFKLAFAHVNYQSRPDSNEVDKFCEEYSRNNCVQYYHTFAKYVNKDKLSFEAWAREERYSFFNDLCDKYEYNWILTAHHNDDQLETLFMRHQQGGDWITMLGIRNSYGRIKRVMLEINKTDILSYAKSKNLRWFFDDTNNDNKYLRNKIRNDLLPVAKRKDAAIIQKLVNSHKDARNKLRILKNKLAANTQDIEYISSTRVNISKKFFLDFADAEKKLIIKDIISKLNSSIRKEFSGRHWRSLWHFIKSGSTGTVFELCSEIRMYLDRTFFTIQFGEMTGEKKTMLKRDCDNIWNKNRFVVENIHFDDHQISDDKIFFILSKDKFEKGIYIRNWESGDRIYLYPNGNFKKVSDLFIEYKIPLLNKNNYPIVVDKMDNILWIPGIRYGILKDNIGSAQQEKYKIKWNKL